MGKEIRQRKLITMPCATSMRWLGRNLPKFLPHPPIAAGHPLQGRLGGRRIVHRLAAQPVDLGDDPPGLVKNVQRGLEPPGA